MQFYSPESFLWLWSVPALILLFIFSQNIWKKRLEKFGTLTTIRGKLMPSYNPRERHSRLFAMILVLVFTVMALARPQWGEEKKKIQRKGVDIIFLLDTSLSMLAEDVKPNRFEKSKMEIRSIVGRLKGDRIGMVAFAGSSFLQSPLTLDYAAFRLFLDAIKVGYIPDPGTSLDRALRLAIRSFPEQDNKHRAVILLTDGEDHEGGLETALEEAKKTSLRVYTIGVGTAQGEPIPLKDESGRKTGFKKDPAGQVVVTKLDQPLLEKVASETGGLYLPATPAEQEIDILLRHMESLGKRQYKEKMISEREDHFQLFLFLAFFFLVYEMLVSRTRKIRAKNGTAVLIFFLLMSGTAQAADPVKLYQEKKYKSAMEVYRNSKVKNPDDPALRYNLGTTLYQLDEFQEASQELGKTVETIQDPKLKAQALYNYGNSQYRLGNFEKAIESYEKALELNPEDKDAKYNLEFLKKKKGSMDKKNDERQQNKPQENKNQNEQKNQQQQQNQQNQQKNEQQDKQQQNQQQQQQNQQQDQQQDQQQNQQNQNQQNSDQKDQPQQDQQNQDQQDQQDKQDQQNQDQKDQQQKDQEQKEKEQQQKDQQQNQQDQQPKDQGEQEQEQPKPQDQGEEEQEQQQPKDPGQEQQDQQPQDPGGDQPLPASQEQGQEQQQGKRPLQGQMSPDQALQILDALKEGEKELQDLRRPVNPNGQEPRRPLKDW